MKPISIKVRDIEAVFGRRVRRNVTVLGLDTATKTGWCLITTTKTKCMITHGSVTSKIRDAEGRWDELIGKLHGLITDDLTTVVIEDTYYRRNPKVFKILTRIGGFAYTLCYLKGIKEKYFITPKESRALIGLNASRDKEQVHIEFRTRIPRLKIKDADAMDATILAIGGLLEDPKLDV
jgi:Holliday junction resolvasome RuvABC endonuclease subunit